MRGDMIEELIREYVMTAKTIVFGDYSDMEAVRRSNNSSDRMRAIVHKVVAMGQDAVNSFAIVLEEEPAALWAAHQLVELAELDSTTLLRCFKRVELARTQAEAEGQGATAMGEEMWLKEWRANKLARYT